jgi:tyrosyl-DNA phosphodiesterase 2
MKPILIGTTQLECPSPPASMCFRERYKQAEHAIAALSSAENVVFGGDMSWDDNTDLPFPLPAGWVDAWTKLQSSTIENNWTYDSFWVEKAEQFNGYRSFSMMKKRSDRFLCRLRDYTLKSIQLIGGETVGIQFAKKYAGYNPYNVELMPSCHRGLVLIIVPSMLS